MCRRVRANREGEIGHLSNESSPEANQGNGQLTLEDVCFNYSEEEPILNNINLTLSAGESIAITGSSGAGKTGSSSFSVDLMDLFLR